MIKMNELDLNSLYGGWTNSSKMKKGSTSSGTTSTGTTATDDYTFNYPSQWGSAENIWNQLASGTYTNAGMDYLKNLLASGGNAVDVTGYGEAQKTKLMSDYSNAVKEMAEQAGVGGVRYGSGLQNSISNYGSQLMANYGADLAEKWLSSQESAASRALSGAGTLGSLGLSGATTGAQGLSDLGSLYANLPLSVSSMLGNLGSSLSSQELNSYTSLLASLLGNTGATAQTYTPSAYQSLFSSLALILPSIINSSSSGYTTYS